MQRLSIGLSDDADEANKCSERERILPRRLACPHTMVGQAMVHNPAAGGDSMATSWVTVDFDFNVFGTEEDIAKACMTTARKANFIPPKGGKGGTWVSHVHAKGNSYIEIDCRRVNASHDVSNRLLAKIHDANMAQPGNHRKLQNSGRRDAALRPKFKIKAGRKKDAVVIAGRKGEDVPCAMQPRLKKQRRTHEANGQREDEERGRSSVEPYYDGEDDNTSLKSDLQWADDMKRHPLHLPVRHEGTRERC